MRSFILVAAALLLPGCTFLAREAVREVPLVGHAIADRMADRPNPDGAEGSRPDQALLRAEATIEELRDRIDALESGSVPVGSCGQPQRDNRGRPFAKCYLSDEKARLL